MMVVFFCLFGCGASGSQPTNESPQPRSDAGVASSAPTEDRSATESGGEIAYPMPATIRVDVHLPGPEVERYLTGTISQEGASWFLVGCISAVRGSCRATQRVALGEADTRRIRTELALVFTTPVSCAQPTPGPGDREYTLTIDGNPHTGFLPSDPAAIPSRIEASVCQAMNRLAWWIVQRFEQR